MILTNEMMKLNGRFYFKEGVVWRSPLQKGTSISLGFPVCTPHESIGDDGGRALAEILNQAIEKGIIPND